MYVDAHFVYCKVFECAHVNDLISYKGYFKSPKSTTQQLDLLLDAME